MARPMTLDPEVFLDAAYLIALAQPGDEFHARALELAVAVETRRVRVVTNRAVLLEVGGALAKRRYRAAAMRLLTPLENAPTVTITPLTEDLARLGWAMFRQRPDKEWSWTDCISFVVMEERRLRQALTTDEHFQQAGFVALLKET